uniref:RING-type E3 ubiquitin transferase n=1 Tax=Kalanchoe fedtschenkoi TaxID=63787 RepID=A0A7N0UTB6_KALFE
MESSHASRSWLLYISVLFCYVLRSVSAVVVLRPYPISFFNTPARFSAVINGTEICGALFVADPPDGCSPLKVSYTGGTTVRFVLIRRGNCVFEDKVRNAQVGGYQAAIVYDDKQNRSPVSMVGNSKGIHIYAVFVSNTAGIFLRDHATGEEGECCISPSIEDAAWTVLWISIISLFVILSALTTLLIARYRRLYMQHSNHHLPVIDPKLVNVLPSILFSSACPHGHNARETCSICLEDYKDGESLRVLPCQHGLFLCNMRSSKLTYPHPNWHVIYF